MNISRISLVAKMRAVALLLSLTMVVFALPQGQPDIVWQQAQAGSLLAYSSDGQILVTGNQLRLAADGTLLRTLTLPRYGSGTNAVALSKDGQYVAIGIQSFNQNLHLFDAQSGTLIQGRISAHNNGTTSVAFSPDSQFLASGGRDGTAKIWHLPDMMLLQTFNGGPGYKARVFAVAYSNDGQFLAVGGQAGVQIFRIADGTLVRSLSPAVSTLCLAFSPDGQILAAGSAAIDQNGQCTDCTVKMWRLADGQLLRTIAGGNRDITAIAFSPDQQVIAVGSDDRVYDGLLRFFRVADGALLDTFIQTGSYITDVKYSPAGSVFAYARLDQLVTVAHNPSTSCSGALSPTSYAYPASGGDGSVSVTAPAGCNWTATSNVSWITLTSATNASGSALVTFEVRENSTGSMRSGTVTIAGQTYTAVQDGGLGDSCDYTISPASQSFSTAGGNGAVNVEALNGCVWEAESNARWVTITSVTGVGNGRVTYTVAANSGGTSRHATITIAGRTFSIKQK